MSYVSKDNQNLLWELIGESGLLHTVADGIPMIQQHFQSVLMKYQYLNMDLTQQNKATIHDMVQYIKSFQDKKDTSESMQQERMETLQQSMDAHQAHFKEAQERYNEIIAKPKPFITFGILVALEYTLLPGFDILLISFITG